ncbi:hypothetical protein K432DRAFT_430593 [Lepidopterella palustris CBS 459.81]|uniref:Uncharacterized protein n=1 Tax=Lepidopterella palustris CBS 459.81 TaxID=1314670 RepID=A0A8E2DX85_9PEZI|nr:hypothetical protein K432DRAFT_430593 [Lepidopterella palustris CBS 459.81]
MFSFLWPRAFYSSQPLPPLLKDDPTGGPSSTVCPSPTGSDHHHYLSDPYLYQGPIDVTPADMPELFDILLSDIDEKVLHNEVSTELGSAYLSETPCLTSPHNTVNGIVFGEHSRALFPLVVRFPRKSRSYVIHFVYNSGSPFTYLSHEACDKLFGTNPVPANFLIQINCKQIKAHAPNASSHFEHVNLLGTDFCRLWGIKVNIDYENNTATIHFPSDQQE